MAQDAENLPDATWELDDEGTLTINPGIIRMGEDGCAPWADVADRVRAIWTSEFDDDLPRDRMVVPPADSTRLFAGMPNLDIIGLGNFAFDDVRDATEMFADNPNLDRIITGPDLWPCGIERLDGAFRGDASLREIPDIIDVNLPYLKSADGALDGVDLIDDDLMSRHDDNYVTTVGSVLVTKWGNGYLLMPSEGPDATGVLPEPTTFDGDGLPTWPWQTSQEGRFGCDGINVMGSIRFPENCANMFASCAGDVGLHVDGLRRCDLTGVRDVSHMFDADDPFIDEDVRALCDCDLPSLERCHAIAGSGTPGWQDYDRQVADHARECGAEHVTTDPLPERAARDASPAGGASRPERPLADYDGPDDDGGPDDDLGMGD